jgi:pantoate--beta-alanine ligase
MQTVQTLHAVQTIEALRQAVNNAKKQGKRVGFVPTMGNLHEGHLTLIDRARQSADFIVCSIFVNPLQFGAHEDLDAYPRTLAADSEKLAARQCDLLFTPTVSEMYPNGLAAETKVEVPALGEHHCGASRPGHFVGVATVVAKLFNMVQADVAVFGEKDFQQLAIIRKMASDLCFPLEIIGLATSREADGLARSSRNGYLNAHERAQAPQIYQQLLACQRTLKAGQRDLSALREQVTTSLTDAGLVMDYLNFADPKTLLLLDNVQPEMVILIAARLGTTRLIDNIVVTGI